MAAVMAGSGFLQVTRAWAEERGGGEMDCGVSGCVCCSWASSLASHEGTRMCIRGTERVHGAASCELLCLHSCMVLCPHALCLA